MLKRSIMCFCTFSFLLTSCTRYASEEDFDFIKIGMKKEDVLQEMSSPGVMRGSIINKFGQVIDVREYEVSVFRPFIGTQIDFYWLYFCNDKLVQWGKAGDWAEAQRIVYDINFKKM